MKNIGVYLSRSIALLSFALFIGFSSLAFAEENNGLPTDKAAHFGIAAAAQTSCSAVGKTITQSKIGAGIACFLAINTAGAVKEATDPYRGGTRDKRDIYANLAGSGLSFLAVSFAF